MSKFQSTCPVSGERLSAYSRKGPGKFIDPEGPGSYDWSSRNMRRETTNSRLVQIRGLSQALWVGDWAEAHRLRGGLDTWHRCLPPFLLRAITAEMVWVDELLASHPCRPSPPPLP